MTLIYKICPRTLWRQAEEAGSFVGAPIDLQDGFIHFSTASQLRETAQKHFAGQEDLVLVAAHDDQFGSSLRYEPSRGGALFPHLYCVFSMTSVVWVRPLPLGDDGHHIFPDLAE